MDQKLARIAQKRADSAPLPRIDAPFVCAEDFKVEGSVGKPTSKNLDHLFSIESREVTASPLKVASREDRHDAGEPTTFLAAARPQARFFPWDSITMETRTALVDQSRDASITCTRQEEGFDFELAMNYGYSAGSPQCLRWITEHVEMLHNPPYADWECSMTCANTQAMDVGFRMFCNRGDWVLMDTFAFSGTIATTRLQGLRLVGVDYDEDGLLPRHLRQILEEWDTTTRGRKPAVLYMVPCGQNPTGTTQSAARRKEIYQVAEEHDLYIFEDDPYYFLSLGGTTGQEPAVETPEDFIARLPPSYLSLDVSGRVMRMDSVSKLLAPGLRIGWITASAKVVSKFLIHTECGALAPSGPSQIMMYKLVDETWGHKGFFEWIIQLSAQYRRRRDVVIEACTAHLNKEVCRWEVPANGLFMWLEVSVRDHPLVGKQSELDIEDRIYQKAMRHRVSVAKGSWFAVGEATRDAVYFRLSWATNGEEALRGAIERFAAAVGEEFAGEE